MSPDPSGIRRGFIVEAGGAVNSIIPIPTAVSTVGRDPSADLCLPYDGVSRQHLRIDGTGPAVFVADAQSTNGTWINDRREAGWTQLSDGDRVKLGSVRLRYFDVASAAPAGIPPTDVHQVTQPQHGVAGGGSDQMGIGIGKNNTVSGKGNRTSSTATRSGGTSTTWRTSATTAALPHRAWHPVQRIRGSGLEAEGEDHRGDHDPTDQIFNGAGPGRVIAIIGALVVIGGFAWFMAHIFRLVPSDPNVIGPPPTIGFAFATFAFGAILLAIGTGMSKARRKRNGR